MTTVPLSSSNARVLTDTIVDEFGSIDLTNDKLDFVAIFKKACLADRDDIAKLLRDNKKLTPPEHKGSDNTLFQNIGFSTTLLEIREKLFEHNCIKVIKWFHSILLEYFFGGDDSLYKAFTISCSFGHIELVKWMLDIFGDYLLKYKGIDGTMIPCVKNGLNCAVKFGKLDVAKLLYALELKESKKVFTFNRYPVSDTTFLYRLARHHGQTNIMNWMANELKIKVPQ